MSKRNLCSVYMRLVLKEKFVSDVFRCDNASNVAADYHESIKTDTTGNANIECRTQTMFSCSSRATYEV